MQKFPDDPVTLVRGESLPGFEGALYRAPARKKGWGILFNSGITSPGRINFTLAHEFGHYLLHRLAYPDGIECSSNDIVRWDSDYGQIELEANIFAANLLMPLDDFRLQIDDRDRPALIELSMCADRYCVSLIAAILRWLEYTRRRACLVLSRDGFVLWARSSKHALRTGIFIKTVDRPPVAIPDLSLASRRDCIECGAGTTWHESSVWFEEECEELVLFSDQYDFTISLLHLSDAVVGHELNEEQEEDTVDLFSRLLHR